VAGDDAPLAVEHLQDWKLGKVGEAAVLDEHVGKQNGIGAGFKDDAIDFFGLNQSALHEMFDAVGRAAAQDVNVRLGDGDVIHALCHFDLGDCSHSCPKS